MVGPIKLSNKLLLAEFLKTVEDKRFDIGIYFGFKGSYRNNEFSKYLRLRHEAHPTVFMEACNTTACVAGHACILWPDMYDNSAKTDFSDVPNIFALQEKLDISKIQAQKLFFNNEATRKDQIALLEKWALEEVDSPVPL